MVHVQLDETDGIATLVPEGALSADDFQAVAAQVDPYIEKWGGLNGLLIHVEHFPGWSSFASLVSHLTFVREHHKKVARVAFATDSAIGNLAEFIAGHFVNAEVKHFDFSEVDDARAWILSENGE